MNKIGALILCIISILITTGCSREKNQKPASKLDLLNIVIEDYDILKKAKAFIIIPNAGCDGCISSAESFVVSNLEEYKGFCVVFTSVSSIKVLRIRTGANIINHNRTIIDNEDVFYRDSLRSVYPIVAYLKNETVFKAVDLSPFSPLALDSLLLHLER